mgnify:CR=1 FL=1
MRIRLCRNFADELFIRFVVVTESYLHFIWKHRLYTSNIKTTEGSAIVVKSTGVLNTDSGPDYFNSKIEIEGQLWVGNVEIHVNASDWLKHKHDKDTNYDNVILHVVLNNDKEVFNNTNSRIPTLELNNFISYTSFEDYKFLMSNKQLIPCERLLEDINWDFFEFWKGQLLVSRLERKISVIQEIHNNNNNDWKMTLFSLLFKYMGMKVNQLPFELLAKSIDYRIVEKCKDDKLKIEALLFGQAGFLINDFNDEYPNQLKKEYLFLKKKYNIEPINSSLWKFLRLRPANFPTIRIAQLASLAPGLSELMNILRQVDNVKTLKSFFETEVNNYWNSHYVFDKLSTVRNKKNGRIIN